MTRPLSLKTEKIVCRTLQYVKLDSLFKIPLLMFPKWSVWFHANLAFLQYVQNFKNFVSYLATCS